MKKTIVGVPEVSNSYTHLQDALYKLGRSPWPTVEATETVAFKPTGRWRFTGDVDDCVIRVEMEMDWTETNRAIRWFPFLSWVDWKFVLTEVIELAPKVFHHTTWVTDTDIQWLHDDTIRKG